MRGERPAWRGGWLCHRKSHVGFKLAGAGRLLEQVVASADAARTHRHHAAGGAVGHAPSGGSSTWHAQRLSLVRLFSRRVQDFDPRLLSVHHIGRGLNRDPAPGMRWTTTPSKHSARHRRKPCLRSMASPEDANFVRSPSRNPGGAIHMHD